MAPIAKHIPSTEFYRFIRFKFASPLTNSIFPQRMQSQIVDKAMQRGWSSASSRYLVTAAQASRLCGTAVKRGERPIMISTGSTEVLELNDLPDTTRRDILRRAPPYFGSGTAIYIDRKWRIISKASLLQRLNPHNIQRCLFIDVPSLREMGLRPPPAHVAKKLNMAEFTRISLYHASQLLNPAKAEPQLGIALNPTTGHRYAQPAHAKLLLASLVFGYVSPYWLTELQATKYFKIKLRNKDRSVVVPTRDGLAVPLNLLPVKQRKRFLSLAPPPPKSEHEGLVLCYDHGNWETLLTPSLVRKLTSEHLADRQLLWVSHRELARFNFVLTTANTPSEALATISHPSRSTLHRADGENPIINLADHSRLTLYNAEETSEPYVVQPRHRFMALLNGRFLSARYNDQLAAYAGKRQFLSPVWVTARDCVRLGVSIRSSELGKGVELKSGAGKHDDVYINADDIEHIRMFLQEKPPPVEDDETMEDMHWVFLIQWRPVLSLSRRKHLSELGRRSNLWITQSELAISDLTKKAKAKEYVLPSGAPGRRRVRGALSISTNSRVVFNAEQTTDPIKVTLTSTMFARSTR